jgi:hypothetical protein
MKGYGGLSRRDLERFDRPPCGRRFGRFVYTEWRQARERRLPRRRRAPLLPVLYALIHQRLTFGCRRRRKCSSGHARLGASAERHRRRLHDDPEHMPTPIAPISSGVRRLIRWGATVGPQTEALVLQTFASRPHPSRAIGLLGLLRLAKKWAGSASRRAGGRSRWEPGPIATDSILQARPDRLPLDPTTAAPAAPRARQCPGPAYYQEGDTEC